MQEPTPAWGLMLQGAAEEYASTAPWITIFPGLATAPTMLGLFGDAPHDAIDPRLRDRWSTPRLAPRSIHRAR